MKIQKVKQSDKNGKKQSINCSNNSALDIIGTCQRSSVVEQRFRKPPAVSSTLTAG